MSIYSMCVIVSLLCFVKWEIQVQLIRKNLPMRLWLKQKKDNLFKYIWNYSLASEKNWLKLNSFETPKLFLSAQAVRENQLEKYYS